MFLAPLAGITDKSFRRLCRECGAALVYTEMVSAKALRYGDRKTEKLLETCEEEGDVAFQVFGSDPEVMANAAAILDSRENVLLDVNMGCPVPKVVKNGDGSALMRDPDLAGRIIEAMRAKTKKPVTAKIRSGWDGDNVNAVEVARTLEAAGAAMICVHARTRDQFYSGKADWDVIARVKAAVSIPVIGNGDVRSREDAERMREQTGCDYVMIGRAALGNPWIFGEPSGQDRDEEHSGDGSFYVRSGTEHDRDEKHNGDGSFYVHPGTEHDGDEKHSGDGSFYVHPGTEHDRDEKHNGDGSFYVHPGTKHNGDEKHNGDGSFYVRSGTEHNGDAEHRREHNGGISVNDRVSMFLRHARLTAEDKGEHIAVLEMRKHAGWYFKGISGAARLRANVNKAATMATLTAEVEAFAAANKSEHSGKHNGDGSTCVC